MKTTHKAIAATLALGLVAGAALVVGPAAADEPTDGHEVVPAESIEWKKAPPSLPPGAEFAVLEGDLSQESLTLWRLNHPANYRVPPHWHPVTERVTVLSGALRVGFGERFDEARTTRLTSGGHFRMAPKHPHFVLTEEPTVVQLTTEGAWGITYVDEQDDPRR